MTEVLPGQLDLFAAIEDAKLDGAAPTLYGSPTRGLAGRAAEFAAWREAHGSFGSFGRSHAWTVHITCPDSASQRCQPTVLSADLRCDCDRYDECSCVGDLMYRGACRHCDWEGEPHDRENAAAEDACRSRVAGLGRRACRARCPGGAQEARHVGRAGHRAIPGRLARGRRTDPHCQPLPISADRLPPEQLAFFPGG